MKGEVKGKGKGQFNGNCHICGLWGHRIADCPEPRQQHGVRYVSDYYQNATSSQVAFMLTNAEDTQVDYRNQWTKVGVSKPMAETPKATIQTDHEDFNRFDSLVESNVTFEPHFDSR